MNIIRMMREKFNGFRKQNWKRKKVMTEEMVLTENKDNLDEIISGIEATVFYRRMFLQTIEEEYKNEESGKQSRHFFTNSKILAESYARPFIRISGMENRTIIAKVKLHPKKIQYIDCHGARYLRINVKGLHGTDWSTDDLYDEYKASGVDCIVFDNICESDMLETTTSIAVYDQNIIECLGYEKYTG